MPELPEVEMKRRFVEAHALGRRISAVTVLTPKILTKTTPEAFRRALEGAAFQAAHRHGKWLFVHASSGTWLALHFGMTGHLEYGPTAKLDASHVRIRFDFTNRSSLLFTDPRMFGEAAISESPDQFLAARRWGPDPTHPGFDRNHFRERLHNRRGPLKSVLLNQKVIAGVGNLYADEMLFQAGLHPTALVADLKPATVDRLYDAMMDVFTASIAVETDFERLPARFLLRYRNSSGVCPKCAKPLAQSQTSGRTGYYCPRHQRRRS